MLIQAAIAISRNGKLLTLLEKNRAHEFDFCYCWTIGE